jgi:hypothetical protein
MQTEQEIKAAGGEPVTTAVLDQSNTSTIWKQCVTCRNVKDPKRFKADTSYKDGRSPQCDDCAAVPRLSLEEHTARLWEQNYYSEATRAQRWPHLLDYVNEEARLSGKWKYYSTFVRELREAVPGKLFFQDGALANHLAVFRIYDQPQPQLEGRTFKYLWGLRTTWMPEYSIFVFTDRDVPVKEKERGWRTPLMRLITTGLLSEARCDKIFGEARGAASVVYRRTLYGWRNRHVANNNKSTVVAGLQQGEE